MFRCRTRRMQGRLNAGHDSLVDSVQERVGPERYRTCKSSKKETDRTGGRQDSMYNLVDMRKAGYKVGRKGGRQNRR